MEILHASPESAEAFVRLSREFLSDTHEHNEHLKPKIPEASFLKKEFERKLRKERSFFIFAVDSTPIGYLYGYVKELPEQFGVREAGVLDDIFVTKKERGRGVSSTLKDSFFAWLKQEQIGLVEIHVSAKNPVARKIYEGWGFQEDDCRLFKEL